TSLPGTLALATAPEGADVELKADPASERELAKAAGDQVAQERNERRFAARANGESGEGRVGNASGGAGAGSGSGGGYGAGSDSSAGSAAYNGPSAGQPAPAEPARPELRPSAPPPPPPPATVAPRGEHRDQVVAGRIAAGSRDIDLDGA